METKSYVGYTKTKRYRVIIKQIEADEKTVFSYFVSRKDLRQVIDQHIKDLNIEQDFQVFIKLDEITEDETSNVDLKVTVAFEESSNLFFVPEPVNFYAENGIFEIRATEEYETTLFFSAIINYEDYPIKILEVLDGLIDKKGVIATEMPIFIILVCYDSQLDGYEIFPLSITVNYYPNEELSDSEKGQKERVLNFRSFVDDLVQQDGWIEKNNVEKK